MDEHSCRENGKKSCECAGIHNHQKEVAPNIQEMKELVLGSTEYKIFGGKSLEIFGGKSLEVHGVQY